MVGWGRQVYDVARIEIVTPSTVIPDRYSSRRDRRPGPRTLQLIVIPRPDGPAPNMPQTLHLNDPLPAPARLLLEKGADAVKRVGQHAPRHLPRMVVAVVFDDERRSAHGPGQRVGVHEAVTVVEEGGVEDGVQCRYQALKDDGGVEGRRCRVDDEDEGDGGIRHVKGFGSLEGTLGCQCVGCSRA